MSPHLLCGDELVIFDTLTNNDLDSNAMLLRLESAVTTCAEQQVAKWRKKLLFRRIGLPIAFDSLTDLNTALLEHVHEATNGCANFVSSRPGARFRVIISQKGTRAARARFRVAGVYSSSNPNEGGSVIFTIAEVVSDGRKHWAEFVKDDDEWNWQSKREPVWQPKREPVGRG